MTKNIFADLLLNGKAGLPAEASKMADKFMRETTACKSSTDQARALLEQLKTLKQDARSHAHKSLVIVDMLWEEYKDHPDVQAAIAATKALEPFVAQATIEDIPQPKAEPSAGLKVSRGHKKKGS